MRSCQGLCTREGIKQHKMIYLTHDGCRTCEIFFPKGKYRFCPCCSHNLSILPRSPKLKLYYRKIMEEKAKEITIELEVKTK